MYIIFSVYKGDNYNISIYINVQIKFYHLKLTDLIILKQF